MAFPAGWNRKCAITLSAAEVDAALTNFPVLLTEACLPSEMFDSDGSWPAQNGGGDLRFTSDLSGTTQLACEVVSFVTDANPANGTAQIHVKVPAVSDSADTTIYVWYSTAGSESQPAADSEFGSQAVWDSNFAAVYHLEQDPSGGAPQILDSTSNANHGTSAGTMTSGDLVDAAVGKGLDFDGSNDSIRLAAAGTNVGGISGNAEFTFECVCNFASLVDFASLVFMGDASAALQAAALVVRSSGAFGLSCAGSNNAHTAGSAVTTGTDYHLVVSKAAGALNASTSLYRNGTSVALSGASSGTPNIDAAGSLGTFLATGFALVQGNISEDRISSVPRSAAWIAATHSTLLTPGTFASAGSPQGTVIAPDDASHGHTAASPAITQAHSVAPADATHGHTAESPTVTQTHAVAPDEANHGHTAASPAITQTHAVAPDEASHGHTAESPTVTQTHAVAPDEANHGHTAESPTVTQAHQIAPDEASHGHTAESPTVTQSHAVAPAEAAHAHTAESPTVTQSHQIGPAEAAHAHTAESPTITQTHQVAPASATHGHLADSPTVTLAPIRPASCRHGHRATMPVITQSHQVAPASATHGHTAGSPAVTVGTGILPHPVAGFTLPKQHREFTLPEQDREFTLPEQRREFTLQRVTP